MKHLLPSSLRRSLRNRCTSILVLAAAASLSGCGSKERVLSGQLDRTQFRLDNAEVIGVSETGRTWRAPVSDNGDFKIALPVGATYSLRFANTTERGDVYDAFAFLTHRLQGGLRLRSFTWSEGENFDLGRVAKVGTLGTSRAMLEEDDEEEDDGEEDDADTDESDEASTGSDSDSDSASADDDDDSASADDDDDSDGAEDPTPVDVCDLSTGADEVEVESKNNLLGDVDTDGDGVVDSVDPDSTAGCHDVDEDSDSDGTSTTTTADSDVDSDSDSDLDGDSDGDSDSGGAASAASDVDVDSDSDSDLDGDSDGDSDSSGGSDVDSDSDSDGSLCEADPNPDMCDGNGAPLPDPNPGTDPNPGDDPNSPTGDADGDGIPNSTDNSDSDGDGVPDNVDPTPGGSPTDPSAPSGDADGDGIPNANDTGDSDGDGVPDNADPRPADPSGGGDIPSL